MTDSLYTQLLDLAGGGLLLTAALVLWRRRVAVVVRVPQLLAGSFVLALLAVSSAYFLA